MPKNSPNREFFPFMIHPHIQRRITCGQPAVRNRGFVLVVTLSLLVLLTVIAVGLLTLSSISLRTSSSGAAQQQAKTNAHLALMLAIGQLQRELGPDQRISAPGGQQLEEGDKSGGNHWIGVYDSWKATVQPSDTSPRDEEILPDALREKTFRRWLISGDESVVTNPTAPTGSAPAAEKVALVAANDDNDAVEAGLIDCPTGRYAWWVGDQNMKAKLGGAVEPATDAIAAAARLQSAPRAAHEVFQGLDGVLPSDERLGKLASTDSLELLSEDIQPFHDATTTSLGLITNVRTGGLRKDLNFLLETPKPTVLTALYSADSPAITYSTGNVPTKGINFYELWVDHNIWGELLTGPPSHADGSSLPSSAPYLQCGPQSDPFLSYKHLPRLQVKLIYSLISESKQVAGKTVYDVYLVVEPIYTVWNPFDVCLYVDPSYFPSLKTWGLPYELTIGSKKGTSSTTHPTKTFKQLGNNAYIFLRGRLGNTTESKQNLVLRPGEVQILAQGYGEPIKVQSVNGTMDVNCKIGYDFASGYQFKQVKINSVDIPASDTVPSEITYKLKPETGKDPSALVSCSYFIGNTDNKIGSFNTGLIYSQTSSESSFNATQRPNIFPTFDFDEQFKVKIESMNGIKWPICVYTYGLRTEASEAYPIEGKRFTGRSMLRANATSLGYDLFDLKGDDGDILRTSPLQHGIIRVNSDRDPAVVPQMDSKGLGYFGAGYDPRNGVTHVVTRSIPREPIHSLGALQHGAAEGRLIAGGALKSGERQFNLQPSVSHAIANSLAPSFLAPDKVRGTLASRPAADHSYLANLALWDTYFYSSIKPRTKSAYKSANTAYSEQKKRLEDFLATGVAYKPLPNERMRPWTSDPDAEIKAIFPSLSPAPTAADRTASFLMVDGMFNVNSTSVTAWKSFLSGLKKAKVPSNPSPNLLGQPKMIEAEGTAVAALLEAAGEEIDDSNLGDRSDAEQWRGFRSLSDEQIKELAKAIVKQVRSRGPFLSIADFVNRRPGSDKELAVSGALQSALDDDDVSINEAYRQGERALSLADANAQGFPFPEAEAGPKAIGSPGYVKQGDLLTSLGPLIAVRGDTFVIRAYGEARDASGKNVLARSWCEAVVQRVPDFLDPSEKAYDTPKSETNLTFGRRFNIISFRYLNPLEIS